MPDNSESLSLKWNPHYGKGRLRRSILLRKKQGIVVGELEDNNHAFRVRLHYDSDKIIDVSGDAIRYPNNTCPDSLNLLKEFIDVPLGKGPKGLAENNDRRLFCNHVFDLASLAYTHIDRDESERRFDIIVEDEKDSMMEVNIAIDNKMVFQWHLKNYVIQNKGIWQGVNIQQGFTRWAMENLCGDKLEAAIALSKAIFVAHSRRVDMDHIAGTQLANNIIPTGSCYVYRSPVIEQSYHLKGAYREYSDAPEKMLQFIEVL